MKKILLSLLAVAGMSTSAFAGTGTLDDPYTVAEVVAMGKDANVPGVYVKGYIVGFINGMSYTNAVFGLPTTDDNQTNIILGGSSAEDDIKYCLPVQLPAGDIRKNLNLWVNPDVLGHQVILGGDIIAYFGQIGIKNTKSYQWIGDAPELGTGGGSGSGDSSDGFLVNGMDDFTIDDVTLPSELNYVWSWDATYGAKASAFYNSTNYAAESILISPEITLNADTKSATFSQALNFLDGNNRADYVNVVVREGQNGQWTPVTVSAWPAGSDWKFVDSCEIDLSAYAGKTIQIGFRYTSSSTCAPTWEVKRLVVGGTTTGGGGGNDNPGVNPGTPEGETVTFDFTNPADLGIDVGDATEYDLTGLTLTSGVVTMLCEGEGAQTSIRLWSSGGNWTFRFYNGTQFTVSVPEGYSLNGIQFDGTNLGTDWSYSNGALSGSTWMPSGNVNSVTISKVKTGNTPSIKTMTVYYSGDAGVEDIISADDSEAVFYNLQGVRVNNPERGIFIKVVGGKAVKVIK